MVWFPTRRGAARLHRVVNRAALALANPARGVSCFVAPPARRPNLAPVRRVPLVYRHETPKRYGGPICTIGPPARAARLRDAMEKAPTGAPALEGVSERRKTAGAFAPDQAARRYRRLLQARAAKRKTGQFNPARQSFTFALLQIYSEVSSGKHSNGYTNPNPHPITRAHVQSTKRAPASITRSTAQPVAGPLPLIAPPPLRRSWGSSSAFPCRATDSTRRRIPATQD